MSGAPGASRLHGALAAAATPLTDDGDRVDTGGIESLAAFCADAGLDGVLVLGTTGEGVLLSLEERRAVAEAFVAALRDRMDVAVHCGAQSTRDTVALAAHAATIGATAVAVIPPPYFALDAPAILAHLRAAAQACAPTPFYVYEFAARSGYAVPPQVVAELRELAPNLAGLKVSDSPFERVAPYLELGLDVFIGAEALIHQGLSAGAAGAVSGLAAALPELTVAAVRERSAEASAVAARWREVIQRFPFHAAVKETLRVRGVRIGPAVRAPLSPLTDAERQELRKTLEDGGFS